MWLGCAAAGAAAAQTNYPGVAYREYARCLPDYLRGLAEDAYQLRNAALAKLSSPELVRERQQWARESFWKLVGGMPERTPLRPRTVGSFERRNYRVEKIVYESQPEVFVSANLYVPTQAKPPFPGVLFQAGHSLNGKAAGVYQKCCQGLVQLGYLVLTFDPMGQGERAYYPREDGYLTRLSSADDEHTYPGKQMLLTGDTSTRLQVWDAVRSLDYLASHPLVDPERLASTGNSGGGTLTMLLAAVDDRLSVAALSCPNTENLAAGGFNPPGSTDDAEQNLINAGSIGYGRWDMLYPLAPKPLLVLVSARDFFGTYSPNYIANGWEEFGKLRKVYETLGAPERIRWQDSPLPHGLSYNMRLEIYRWFARWLKNDAGASIEEPAVRPEDERTLWVTEGGSTVRSLGSETPFTVNRRRAAGIKTPDEMPNLQLLLKAELPPKNLTATVMGTVPSERVDVSALEVRSAPKVWLPAWLFVPRKTDPAKPLLLALEPSGRVLGWREDEIYQALSAEGFPICLPDLRGLGDLRPEFPRGSPRHGRYHQNEENYAWASMMLGKPLLGQRVTDILALATAMRNHAAGRERKLVIIARSSATTPALFAAAMDGQIDRLYLSGGLVSYRDIVETENYSQSFANFLPDVLRHTDLPQVAAGLGNRDVRLAGTTDAAGNTMDIAAVQQIYRNAKNVKVLPKREWTAQTLSTIW
jgi:cephalosporin-C deacetylase-like acetyl esterase